MGWKGIKLDDQITFVLSLTLWICQHAYIFLNGVSGSWSVGDAVLCDRAYSRFPADSEGARCRVIYLQVPWSTTWHWGCKKTYNVNIFTYLRTYVNTRPGAMSFYAVFWVLTCLSSITDSWTLAITIQSNHPYIVIGGWEQLLQHGCGAWYHNLHTKSDIGVSAAWTPIQMIKLRQSVFRSQ